MARKKFFKKGNKKGKSHMPKNKKALVSLIKRVDHLDDELKQYAYQPTASGVVNTTGLKYLLNAAPYGNATVTAGVVDTDTAGLRGPGGGQILGKDYYIKSIGFKAQIRPNTDDPIVVRMMIIRELAPEGIVFSTGPFSLLHTQAAGLSVLAPIWKTNLLRKDGTGRFKIYYDKTVTLHNSLITQNDHKMLSWSKTFRQPVKVVGYESNGTYAAGSTAAIGNIQNNGFYALIFCNVTTLTVDQVYSNFTFTDA